MAVAVFGQLDYLLRARNLTIADFKRQIEEQDGLVIDPTAVDDLASSHRLQQMDLTTVGAVASALDVALDDLLLVVRIPYFRATKVNRLSDEETWRLWALLGLQQRRDLSDGEQREMESLVENARQRADDDFWRKEAQRRGVSFEELQSEREEDERDVKAMKHRDESDALVPRQEPIERAEEARTPASR